MEPIIRCRATGLVPVMFVGMTALFTFIVGPILIIKAIQGGPDAPGPAVLLWFAVLAWFWFVLLYLMSFELRLFDDGRLECRSVLRRRRLRVTDIKSIGPWLPFDTVTFAIRTSSGNAYVPRQMTNMFDFATVLRDMNPAIDLSRF